MVSLWKQSSEVLKEQALMTNWYFCRITYDASDACIEKMFNKAFAPPIFQLPQALRLAMDIAFGEFVLRDLEVKTLEIKT